MNEFIYYFAYGSNLHPLRLRQRTPSCQTIGVSVLAGYALRLHKKGRDGSAKCNAFFTGSTQDRVHGVIYKIDMSEKCHLDQAESLGSGYHEKALDLSVSPSVFRVFTYVADGNYIDDTLKPFTWYKDVVLQGAQIHGLPASYIETIARLEATQDPDKGRAERYARILSSF